MGYRIAFLLAAVTVALLMRGISDTFGCGWVGGVAAGVVWCKMFPEE